VIVRSCILPEQTNTELIKQLQADIKEAINHRDVPVKQVIERIKCFRPVNSMASITMMSSAQEAEQNFGWEVVQGAFEVLTKQQRGMTFHLNCMQMIFHWSFMLSRK
jgi:hypothetical protein